MRHMRRNFEFLVEGYTSTENSKGKIIIMCDFKRGIRTWHETLLRMFCKNTLRNNVNSIIRCLPLERKQKRTYIEKKVTRIEYDNIRA